MDIRLIEQLYDANVRAEEIIHLGTQCLGDNAASVIDDALNQDWDGIWAAIGRGEPQGDELDFVAEHIVDKRIFGFLVQFATPVPKHITDDSYSFSWGWYHTRWIYADSFDDACQQALVWRTDYIARQREKAA